ncbi:phosphomannomutase/phosphoglucomutase [Pseudomonadota bacterium]
MNQTLSSSPAAEIFKAYDIRGIVDKTLTEEAVRSIGHAVGSEAVARQQRTVVVGRDGRLSGPKLVKELAIGLNQAGVNVIDIGVVPTPVLYFATFHLNTGSGIAVTGSHNPPEYNGLKMMLGNDTLSGAAIQALRQRIEQNNLTHGQGELSRADVINAYVQKIVGDVKLARPLKIVVDCGNGVAGAIAPDLYRQLGCEVEELFCEVDGNFPNHHPDPSQLDNLQDLIKAVVDSKADVGLAFDGDGDRLGVISPNGSVIWPDRQLILFAEDILQKQKNLEIIYDVKCSRTLPVAISNAGGIPTMWKTGHSFMKAKLKESGAALAGEMSGHMFFNDRWYGFDDGVYTGARLLELLSRRQQTPAEIFAQLPDTINTPELRLDMEEGAHYQLIEKLVKNADFPDASVSNIDGLRVDFDDGFGLVRASNTTPMLIMRFEADNDIALERIQNRFRNLINSTQPGLSLPF